MVGITADEIIQQLALKPLPVEGGYYAETYRLRAVLPLDPGVGGSTGERHLKTAIYYLLTPDTFSALHRLPGDEVYHFYLGDPVDLVLLGPEGLGKTVVLGTDFAAGMRPQAVAPGGSWQGSSLRPGGSFALLGTTMSPGYHGDDFELGGRESLTTAYPAFAEVIRQLTR